QMPIHMRMPKRGFNNPNSKQFAVINLGNIQSFIDAGKLDAGQPITEETLVTCGLVRRKRDGVRVLAKGELTAKVALEVTGASKSAVAAVEAQGGSVKTAEPAAQAEG
ncbi:MAG: uL15m family ribosomal protein, partial [Pseudomonadota bacterium]